MNSSNEQLRQTQLESEKDQIEKEMLETEKLLSMLMCGLTQAADQKKNKTSFYVEFIIL